MSHCISSILLPYILHGTVRGVVSLVPIPAQLELHGDDGCSSTGGDGGECTLYHGKEISVIAS